ncbi:MAG: tetratricopeptide repeat protein [Candidatus Sulfotelmatobacter sp.]
MISSAGLGRRATAVGFLFLVVLSVWVSRGQNPAATQDLATPAKAGDRNGYAGNEACGRCHSKIFESYQRTAMARASGPAIDALTPAEFTHQESGVHYRIYAEGGRAWLSFDRPGDSEVRGKRELLYYIGSGRRGRSYLFETDGFLFESPVNWYANKQMWDMAPAYQTAREIPLSLPAYTSCLHCHASGIQPPAKDTDNRYPKPPFLHNGVSCERCHGPGAQHATGGEIVNPAKLAPARRDEVCMQCHLEGKVAIERSGRHAYEFRPGDELSDYVRYFVLTDSQASSLGAVSQVEALAQSQCKKKSGDAMSCTSCHTAHLSPASPERVAYYRGKCLACHGAAFAAKHHVDQPDCLTCHMPASASSDVAHTEVTDHRILRRPQIEPQLLQDRATESSPSRLVPFPPGSKGESDLRDLALAWESLVESGMTVAGPQAQSLLSKALKQSPEDPALLSALGYIEQRHGDTEKARVLYQKALAVDPQLVDASVNLAVIEARSGKLGDAIALWQKAFALAPGRSSIGLNLVQAYCSQGRMDEARTYTLRVLEFNPDLAAAKQMLRYLHQMPSKCGL